ncbi:MAG: hypothetical protein LBS20_20385 [Prevotella sp.]|jgi:hypothetical protein|nr:hypothetical protein [Prevotella sp.]
MKESNLQEIIVTKEFYKTNRKGYHSPHTYSIYIEDDDLCDLTEMEARYIHAKLGELFEIKEGGAL